METFFNDSFEKAQNDTTAKLNDEFEQHCPQSPDLEISTHTPPKKLVYDLTVKLPTPTQDVVEEFFNYLFAKAARGEMKDPIIISEDDPWPDDAEIREVDNCKKSCA